MGTHQTILVVDDDPHLRKTLGDILRARGYVTVAVADGATALKKAEEDQLAVALIDLKLEGMSGLDVLKGIKARSPGTECLVLTGYATQDSAIDAINLGAYGYVCKPYDQDQLLVTIHRAMEKQEAKAALWESQQQYHTLVSEINDGIFEANAEGVFTFANQAFARIHGFEHPDMLIGHNFLEFVTPAMRDDIQDRFRHSLTTGMSDMTLTFEILRPDGTSAFIEGEPVFVKEGNRVVGIRGVIRDITERIRAEAQLRLRTTALEAAANGIMLTDREGAITWINQAFTTLTGYTAAEAVGQTPRLLKSDAHDPAFYQQLWDTILAGQVWQGELVNRHKDGRLYTEEQTITPVRDAQGTITHFIAIKQDITARKQLEAELLQAQKMEVVGRLSGGVAHDFNNLLTVMIGYADLLRLDLDADHPMRQTIDEIHQAALNAAALTRQLLAFSRRQVLQPQVLNLNTLIAQLENMLRRLIGEDIVCSTQLDPVSGCVYADPGQLEQVLMNLVVNARDAMPQGGTLTIMTANIEVDAPMPSFTGTIASGAYVQLKISDTGCGMDADTLSHIFEPFFTTKAPDKGTGLGLSTIYGIVTQSKGYIDVESESDRGTAFTIYLPRVPETTEAPAESGRSHVLPRATETVLLVEDEMAVRTLTARILRHQGYTVLEAAHGEAALRLVQDQGEEPIHLLITDLVMPNMGGQELAQHLKRVRPALRVLYMSGYIERANIEQRDIPTDLPLLQKPFTPSGLARTVHDVLDVQG